MELNKIEIVSDLAHFKIPLHSKIQRTYEIPPISTVVGILQNIYGEDIDNFILGYSIEHEGIFRDLHDIYKEFNMREKSFTDKDRFTKDPCEVQYLINPKIIIYTNLNAEEKLTQILNLGKTDCLAKINKKSKVNLINKEGIGYNQYTNVKIGSGVIERITTETRFNDKKDYFDIFTGLVRRNYEFEYDKYFDEEEDQNIFLWKWNKGGIINELS